MNDTGKAVPDARSSDRDYVVPDSDKARRTDVEVTRTRRPETPLVGSILSEIPVVKFDVGLDTV